MWNLGATPNLDGLVPASILAMSYHKAILSALSWAQRTAADNSAMAWAVAYTISHTMMRVSVGGSPKVWSLEGVSCRLGQGA